MRVSAILATVLLGTGLTVDALAQEAGVELKIHHFLPAQAPAQRDLIEPWAKAVEEQSDGRITARIFPAMQLGGKAPQLIDQVRDGVVDVVWTLPSYTPGRYPAISVFELPFVVSNAEATSQAVQEYYETQPAVQEEFEDVHPLFFFTHDRGVIHTKGVEVTTLDDLQGLKIRIPSRPVGDAFAAYGATPVSMPVPQTPEALAKNVIDGTVVPWEVVPPLKLHELTDHSTEITGDRGLYTSVFLFAMNKDTYENLPDDLKKVIDDNSGMAWAQKMGQAWDRVEEPGLEAARARGNTITTMAEGEAERMREQAQPVIDAWIADADARGLDGQALYDAATGLVEKYTKDGGS